MIYPVVTCKPQPSPHKIRYLPHHHIRTIEGSGIGADDLVIVSLPEREQVAPDGASHGEGAQSVRLMLQSPARAAYSDLQALVAVLSSGEKSLLKYLYTESLT